MCSFFSSMRAADTGKYPSGTMLSSIHRSPRGRPWIRISPLPYGILSSPKNVGVFEYEIIADRKRITKESFERWYAGQRMYRKLCDRSEAEQAQIEELRKEAEKPRLKVPDNKAASGVPS